MYGSPGEKRRLSNLSALYLATGIPLKTTRMVGVYLVFGVQSETVTLNLGCLPPSGLTFDRSALLVEWPLFSELDSLPRGCSRFKAWDRVPRGFKAGSCRKPERGSHLLRSHG